MNLFYNSSMTLLPLIYLVLCYYLICWGSCLWLKNILEGNDGYYFIRNRQSFYGNLTWEILLNPWLVNIFVRNLSKYWVMRFSIYQSLMKWHRLKAPLETKTILMLKEEFGDLYNEDIDQFNKYR